MRERVARAAAAASSAASTEVNAYASKAETIVSRMKRMRRLGAEGEEATFIVDTEFKRINPLLQMQNSMPSEWWPLSLAPRNFPSTSDISISLSRRNLGVRGCRRVDNIIPYGRNQPV